MHCNAYAECVLLQFLQFCEIHAQSFFAVLALELHFHELGSGFHFAFEDDTLAEFVVADPIAWFILLDLWTNRLGFLWRRWATALALD
jgi:hypothetical protein